MAGTFALLLLLAGPPPAPTPSPTPCAETTGPGEIEVKAGTRIHAEPDPSALSVAVVDADMTLPVSSRCGDYAEVRWGGVRGWVRPDDTEGRLLERGARRADATRVARARQAMEPRGREARLGPWRLVTDVPATELKGLGGVASHLAETYTSRTGLVSAPDPDQTLAIFSTDARYRAFADTDDSQTPGTRGHAGGGLAALGFGRTPLATRVLLVHELTHLLSRNALGERIPAWLDEGLAEDLAWCRVDASGRIQTDTLDAYKETRRGTAVAVLEMSGPRVTVDAWLVRARAGRIPPLEVLLSSDPRLVADPEERRDAATASAMLVRWCLADPARAAAFREFLKAVSLGGAGDAYALAGALAMDVPGLEKAFLKHLRGL